MINFVALTAALIIGTIIVYAIYLTFDPSAFLFSILLTVSLFILKPDLLDGLKKNPVLQYYPLIITFSLMMALDQFKNSSNYIFLIIINMIMSIISFLTHINVFMFTAIYLNMYVLSMIANAYRYKLFEND